MKKQQIIKLILVLILSKIGSNGYSQTSWDINGNSIIGSEYLGADNTSTIPVRFQHLANSANSRFEWYTNNSGTTAERMRLTQTGFLGLGITNPLSHLHLNISSANEVFSRFSNTLTGNSANDGFKIGILGSGEVQLYQYEAKPITFHTFKTQRVIITAGGFSITQFENLDNSFIS